MELIIISTIKNPFIPEMMTTEMDKCRNCLVIAFVHLIWSALALNYFQKLNIQIGLTFDRRLKKAFTLVQHTQNERITKNDELKS